MVLTNSQESMLHRDKVESELRDLIDEGYKAMQDGKVSTIEEVRVALEQQRARIG